MTPLTEIYKIRRTANGKYEVYNKDTGHVYGTHDSREDALKQQRVLYMKVPPDKEMREADDFEDGADDDVMESVPANAPESDFADPPSGLYIGDAKHAAWAVQAVTSGLEGNKAKARNKPGVKTKIASAIRKFYSGDLEKYYLSWLHTGKKPGERPASEVIHEMLSFSVPSIAVSSKPDVPLAPGVDIEAIRAKDPSPVFITRPIGILDGLSENGLRYNDYLLREVERQVIAKRPPARLGHVPDADKSWKVPDAVGFWVGALRVGDILYGKCYILPNRPFHDEVQVSDAVGSQLSNSIYGDASLSIGEDGEATCVGLALESIDFVPPERAALQALGGDFEVTREMKEGDKAMAEGHDDKAADLTLIKKTVKPEALYEAMSDEQKKHVAEAHLRECAAAMVKDMLSEAQRGAVVEARMKEAKSQEVYEMLSESQRSELAETLLGKLDPEHFGKTLQEATRKVLAESLAKGLGMKLTHEEEDQEVDEKSLAEMKTLQASLAEMQTTLKRYEREDFERSLDQAVDGFFADWQVRGEEGKKKVDALKKNLRVLTVAEMAGSTKIEDIKPNADKAWENVKPLAEMTKASLAGPSAYVGVNSSSGAGSNPYGYDKQTGRYSDEAVSRAVQRANMPVVRGGNS